MNILVDDHLLREVLLEGEPTWVRRARRDGQLFTTGSWYYRLCGALHDPAIEGELSGPVAQLPEELRRGVIERVATLPASVHVLSLRDVGWSASGRGRRHGLNLLAAEALGAALASKSAIGTAAPNLPPRLAIAAAAEKVRILTPPAR